jgi:hydrogenase-4 transcriptional activator
MSTNTRTSSVVARARQLSPQSLIQLIESAQQSAADFRHDEAVEKLSIATHSRFLTVEHRAKVNCTLAEALENLSRYREALEILKEYEGAVGGRSDLNAETIFELRLRMGSLYGYLGDHPQAITFLKSALDFAETTEDHEKIGSCHYVMGRIYRAIGEAQFARDHLQLALRHNRHFGEWLPLAQCYLMLGNVCLSEGDFMDARENFEQSLKIIGDRRAPLLLGTIFNNISNIIIFQEFGQSGEGVLTLEKAIFFLKEAKNDRLLANAYNNLGYALTQIGEWERASEMLNSAITLGEIAGNLVARGAALDTLGEILLLQGRFEESEQSLNKSINELQKANFTYAEVQTHQTLGRCYLAQWKLDLAEKSFKAQFDLAVRVEDKRNRILAQIYLAQVQIEYKNFSAAQELLNEVTEEIEASSNASTIGLFRIVNGMLHHELSQFEAARHDFGQAITVFSIVRDPYREAYTRYCLGKTLLAMGDEGRGCAELQQALATSLRLKSEPLTKKIKEILPETGIATSTEFTAAELSPAIILRLTRAVSSRELLLNELTELLHEVTNAHPVVIFEQEENRLLSVACNRGGEKHIALIRNRYQKKLLAATSDIRREIERATAGGIVYKLRSKEAQFFVFLGCQSPGTVRREQVETLFRLAEMGLTITEKQRQLSARSKDGAVAETSSDGFIFASPAMQELVANIKKIRSSRVTVLITGESGTGKEVVARAIHNISERRDAPFSAFNCTIASPEVVNSQLFGHKKGAFTGATSDTVGVITVAHKGTLLLDEIGDLSLEVQPKLLRFLQDGEVHRLGDNKPTNVDVRVIAATNVDLEKLVREGSFREDLYYRLNIIRFRIPPLRERREEIPILIEHYLSLYCEQSEKQRITIEPRTLDLLTVYDWPGNVRQLANELQRLVAYKDSGEMISAKDLSPAIYDFQKQDVTESEANNSPRSSRSGRLEDGGQSSISIEFEPGEKTLSSAVDALESQIILDSMRRHKGHRDSVCEELGITRKGLYLKLRRLPGIDLAEF